MLPGVFAGGAATIGGGRFYLVSSGANLPALVSDTLLAPVPVLPNKGLNPDLWSTGDERR